MNSGMGGASEHHEEGGGGSGGNDGGFTGTGLSSFGSSHGEGGSSGSASNMSPTNPQDSHESTQTNTSANTFTGVPTLRMGPIIYPVMSVEGLRQVAKAYDYWLDDGVIWQGDNYIHKTDILDVLLSMSGMNRQTLRSIRDWTRAAKQKEVLQNATKVAKTMEKEVLQKGGQAIKNSTWKKLGIDPIKGGKAIHELKKANNLKPNFHGKIMSNGDYLHPETGELIDNILDYVH